MNLGPDPVVVEPSLGDTSGEVVTIKALGDTIFERTVTYPDGSASVSTFGDWSALATFPGEGVAMGPDAAARRLGETAAGTLLYCHGTKAWFAWDGAIWRRDRTGLVPRMIRETLREAGLDDPGARLVAGTEAFARAEAALSATAEEWDADPLRLGTPGGTIDLTTGALRPADPTARITRATAVTPSATADCPLWRRFLDETTGGDIALAGFLQRFLGYALTGATCEHTLVFGLGDGGNGKSVFANTVRGIFGDYAAVASADLLAQAAGRATHTADIAMLSGARLVTLGETEEGRLWADGRLKLLTGGDPVTARFLGRDFFTFTPRFKLLVLGNHMPVLRTVDAAIRRRLCVVPFATRPATPDPTLQARLTAEWPGILRWMIEGCLAWRTEGLTRPDSVRAATSTYLGGQDMVGQFLAEACDMAPDHVETAGALYAAWCAYAKATGEVAGAQRRFSAQLERHGLLRERTRHARCYRGARLLRPEEREPA